MINLIFGTLATIGALSIIKLIFTHKKDNPSSEAFSIKDTVSFFKFLIETETISEMGKINLIGGVLLVIAIIAYFIFGTTISLIPDAHSEPGFKYILLIPITFTVCMAFTSIINQITSKYENKNIA